MIKWILSVGCLLVCLAVSQVQAGSSVNMNPGLWEISSQVKMPGMDMPASTTTQCITKDSLVPQANSGQGQCEITDVRIQGDTVSWSISCDGQGGVITGTGESTYYGDTFEGTSRMRTQGMDITTTMSGKRIGDCQ